MPPSPSQWRRASKAPSSQVPRPSCVELGNLASHCPHHRRAARQGGATVASWVSCFTAGSTAPQCIEVKSSLNTPQCTVESFKAWSTGSAVHSAGQLHSRPQLSSLQCSVSHLLDHHALLWPSALHATFTHLLKSDNFPTFFTVQVFAVCLKTDQFIALPFEQCRALK